MPSAPDGDLVIIKKYANRRLYNTESSTYITLEHLAEMVRAKREFKVVDAKTGEDITHNVLTQIIMEEEARGTTMLPANFLRQLISMYGDNMQSMVPQYLEESLAAFGRNQSQLQTAVADAWSANPFAEIAKRNLEMFQAAAAGAAKPVHDPEPAPEPDNGPDNGKAELAELRAQLAALQAKLDKLGG